MHEIDYSYLFLSSISKSDVTIMLSLPESFGVEI
jgi:hypothetical protein